MANQAVSPRIQPGDNVAGRFRIVEQIGSGGFSVVYRAYQENMNRFVALKVLKPSISDDDSVVERFRREALFASHLSHPNTITLFDYGRTDGDLCYIAMEYLEGTELGNVVRDHDGLGLTRVWSILTQTSQSLAEAHRLGLIHRDLKPENIYLVEQGHEELVKVLDFGLSKTVRDTSTAGPGAMTPLTQEGKVFGTPLYMAPEQAQDEAISPAIDVYALGHIAYEMITGEARYGDMSTAMDIMLRQIYDPPLELPSDWKDTPFDKLIRECTHKEASDRIGTADELYDRLASEDFIDYMPPGPHRDRLEERSAAHRNWGAGLGTETSYVQEDEHHLEFEPELERADNVLKEVIDQQELRVLLINGPRGGGRTELLYELIERIRNREDLQLVHRESAFEEDEEDRGLAADIAQLKEAPTREAADEGLAPMVRGSRTAPTAVDSELTQRESAFFGNLGGKRETIFSKTARLFRDRAADTPIVWVLERLEQTDAFSLAFLNWFYQDLQTEPAPVMIAATVSRADLVDRAGLLRYTQAILGGTEPTVRRFFISRAASPDEPDPQMGSGAAPIRSTLDGDDQMSVPNFGDSGPADGGDNRETLSGGISDDPSTSGLFDQSLGLLAQLGDEIPKDLWERVREEFLSDQPANMVEFILERAEQFGIIEQTDGQIRFGRPTFAERLRKEAREDDDGIVEPDTRAGLARLMLDVQDRPDRETIERAVDHFKEAGRPTEAVEALHQAGNDAFSMLDLDSAREYYLRLQHVFEQLSADAVERVREELDADPARIWLRIGETHGALDEHGAAEDALKRAARFAEGRQSAVRGRALKLIADIQTAEGRYSDAERNYESAALAFRRADREAGAAAAKSLMGETVLQQGFPQRAQEIFEETLDDARSLDLPLVVARTQFRLGRARLRQGDFEGAFACLEQAASGFEQLQRPTELVRTEMTFGNAAFAARKFDQAGQRFSRARENSADVRHFDGDFPSLGLARAYAAEGQFDAAADCIDDQDAPDRRARAPVQRVEWRRHQGDLFLVHGAYPAAGEHFKQMGSEAREIGRTDLFLDALLRNAFVAFHADSYESAAQRITRAADFVQKFGDEAQSTLTQVLGLYLHAASRGFPNETEDLAQHLDVANERGFDWVYTLASICLGDIRAANGHFRAARELLRLARDRATAVGHYSTVAAVGHRIDRIAAIDTDQPPPTIPGALIGGPAPPEVHRLHPDELYQKH